MVPTVTDPLHNLIYLISAVEYIVELVVVAKMGLLLSEKNISYEKYLVNTTS
jgi:hypothetical protein